MHKKSSLTGGFLLLVYPLFFTELLESDFSKKRVSRQEKRVSRLSTWVKSTKFDEKCV